mmetsp:Transcript_37549/g.61039  ORF Transcript_37549/g.61039 Transcript_37549/m.61039 type:complete len:158 (-) Transcript_37549:629-1102(-)
MKVLSLLFTLACAALFGDVANAEFFKVAGAQQDLSTPQKLVEIAAQFAIKNQIFTPSFQEDTKVMVARAGSVFDVLKNLLAMIPLDLVNFRKAIDEVGFDKFMGDIKVVCQVLVTDTLHNANMSKGLFLMADGLTRMAYEATYPHNDPEPVPTWSAL